MRDFNNFNSYSSMNSRLNFAHLNPGSAVQHIGELNDLFRVFCADRGGGRRCDGVALYLRESMRYKVVARSTPTSVVDYLFVELRLPYPVLVCAIYNSPKIGPESESLVSKYSNVLVLGEFVEGLQNLNLLVHSSSPTYFQGQPTCIDLFVTLSGSNFLIKLTFPAFQPHMISCMDLTGLQLYRY
jgi:hypothetical protein